MEPELSAVDRATQLEALVDWVIQVLVQARLVVADELQARGESNHRVTVVDVAHEALIISQQLVA